MLIAPRPRPWKSACDLSGVSALQVAGELSDPHCLSAGAGWRVVVGLRGQVERSTVVDVLCFVFPSSPGPCQTLFSRSAEGIPNSQA